ncbi:MAG: SDR family NAD(P)-dependent oxidoreductase [Caldilineaceae bacterium]
MDAKQSTVPAKRPAVVVTGVSTGIGLAIAQRLVAQGYHLFGTVRQATDADRLQALLGATFTPLLCDVTDAATLHVAAQVVSAAMGGRTLAGLVNNAGIAMPGPLLHLPLDALRRQFEVNLIGLVAATQAFAPLLGAAPVATRARGAPGRIVNISSVSGRLAWPFMGAYAASKFGVEALSDSLRRELVLYGVDVIVIQPGAVQSEIWGKEPEYTKALLQTDYAAPLERYRRFARHSMRTSLPADKVAVTVQRALEVRRPRSRYAVVRNPLTGWWLPRLLPHRRLDRLAARAMGLKRLS